MTIQQSHFRIRNIGALQTINQDSDWAEDLDVDATLDAVEFYSGCLFGLRFELEEIVSASTTIIPKIQYRVNAGTWTDCSDITAGENFVDPATSTAASNVAVINKATITDGAVTTNILTGSAKAFVAGTGEHDTVGASITLNNQHTEIEWRIVIRNRYDTLQESVTGDEYEFRVVESDDTLLGGTYVIPKITLNLTDGYIGGTGVETGGTNAFIRIPDGTLYTVLEGHRFNPDVTMLKSIDGGITWLQEDEGNSPSQDAESWSMQYDDTNKVIHCLHMSGSGDYYQFGTKDHATLADQWITANEAVIEASIDSAGQSSALMIRGTNVYAFYSDLQATDQVWYRKKADLTSGTWAARVSIDTAGGSSDFIGVAVVLGPNSDLIHIFYIDWGLFNLHHVSLNTSDVLGTKHTCESDLLDGSRGRSIMTGAISWYNGSVEKAMIGYLDNENSYLYTVVVEEDGTPDARQLASNSTFIFNSPAGVLSEQPVADIGHDPADDTIYTLYVDDATHDLWRASRSDAGSWTGHTEESDAREIYALRGVIYTKADNSVVFGYIFDEAYNQDATPRAGESGTNGYEEYLITAGSTDIDDRQPAYTEGLRIFPFAEDFSIGGDGDEWNRGNWVTSSG